jgi:predicted transposase/invertase (TIGR01784 family)
MEIIHSPHDKIFGRVLSVKKNAVSLLRNILPELLQKHLVIEEICFEKDSFIPNNLKNYYSDLLASVPVVGQDYEARVYFLFEHKSTNFSNTPLQLLRYMLEIWDQYGKTQSAGDKLPVIIPVMITHPRSGWKGRKLSQLVDVPSDEFKAYIPDFDYRLYDSVKEDPEHYEFNEQLKALLTIWRYSHSNEFMEYLIKVFDSIKKIEPESEFMDFLVTVMHYLYSIRGEEEYIEIEKIADKELSERGKYMGTISEMLERRGAEKVEKAFIQEKAKLAAEYEQRGEKRGKLENAQEMILEALSERYSTVNPVIVKKIKNVQSLETLKMLFKQCFRVDSLEEFKEQLQRATED